MANVLVEESCLSGIASAIRSADGLSTLYKPSEMMAGVNNAVDKYYVYYSNTFSTNSLPKSNNELIYYNDSTSIQLNYFAFAGNDRLMSVNLPNCTSLYGCGQFLGCNNLTIFNAPNLASLGSTTSYYSCGSYYQNLMISSIGAGNTLSYMSTSSFDLPFYYAGTAMFYQCKSLSSVNFGNITSIPVACFYGCDKLETLVNSSISNIPSYAFTFCSKLANITTTNVNKIGFAAFYGTKFTSISFPSITWLSSASFAFNSCSTLSEIYFNNLSSITSCRRTFESCKNLLVVSMPKVSLISASPGLFEYCYSLSSLYFPSLVSIVACSYFAAQCSSLAEFNAPNLTKLSNGSCIFFACSNLSSFYAPKLNSLPAVSYLFDGTKISIISFSDLVSISSNTFYTNTSTYRSNIIAIKLNKLTTADAYTFANYTNVTSIELQSMQTFNTGLFRSCWNLPAISLPNASVFFANVFSYCSKLVSLYLMGSSVCKLSSTAAGTFSGCPILHSSVNGNVYGSIYVPSSLYATYIASTNWVAISSRFVSM